MIDWHSHILHGVDDGSRSLEECIKLIDMLYKQGVKTVIATPHFIADNSTVEDFLKKRDNAYNELREYLQPQAPKILLGAEVKYYSGISKLEGIKKLKIEQSNILLLEMPINRWTEYTLRELEELSSNSGLTVVLAHIERYLGLQDSKTFKRLLECGILMQANASFFIGMFSRKKALSLLKNGIIHFIGSDCHNIDKRPPKMDVAFSVIEKKFGKNFISQLNKYSYEVLEFKY